VRATLVQAFASLAQLVLGSAVIGTLLFQWRGAELAQQNLEVVQRGQEQSAESARANLENARQGQFADRFTRAIDQLGSADGNGAPQLEIRLGGIYALERVALHHEYKLVA
jgi:hypothetical protein